MLEISLFAITILFPLLMTFIPFKADILDVNKRKLTPAGWLFVALGIGAISAAIWLGRENGRDMESLQTGIATLNKKYDDHARSDSAIGLTFDPKTNKLILVDTQLLKNMLAQPAEEKPVLELSRSALPNPRVSMENDSTYLFEIDLKTNSKDITSAIEDKNILIEQVHGMLYYMTGTSHSSANENSQIGEETYTFHYETRIILPFSNMKKMPDTMYAYEKILYSNRDGKKQPPFSRIFLITEKYMHSDLPEASSVLYSKVKDYLVKQNKW
jgi:hypothetical protein